MASITYRPLGPWLEPRSRPIAHSFTATWGQTAQLLRREVEQITDRRRRHAAAVVIEVDAPSSAFRLDGGMLVDRKPLTDGVVVSFESLYGPLRYSCDRFTRAPRVALLGWQANVRAIALALESLRRVSRYGVGGKGEQYAGWAALNAAPTRDPVDQARALLLCYIEWGEKEPTTLNEWLGLYRRAVKLTHPDTGGDAASFNAARDAFNLIKSTYQEGNS